MTLKAENGQNWSEWPEVPEGVKTPPATPQKSRVSGGQKRALTPRYYQFEKQNEVTIKMTDGDMVIVEGSFGADNYKVTRALGYLMKVGDKWVAAVGKQRSKPLPLYQAKVAAKDMHRDPGKDFDGDLILALNRAEAAEVDRSTIKRARRTPTVDLLGGSRRGLVEPGLRKLILDAELHATPEFAEPLRGDDYQLDYYDDGYPILPACLRRRS